MLCSVLPMRCPLVHRVNRIDVAWWLWCVRAVVFTVCVKCVCVVRVRCVCVCDNGGCPAGRCMVPSWSSVTSCKHRFASAMKVNAWLFALTTDRDLESALSKSIHLRPPRTVNYVLRVIVCCVVCVVCARCECLFRYREWLEESGTCCSRLTLKLQMGKIVNEGWPMTIARQTLAVNNIPCLIFQLASDCNTFTVLPGINDVILLSSTVRKGSQHSTYDGHESKM